VIAGALRDNAVVHKATPAEKRSNLRTFICGHNRVEDGSVFAWAEAFAAHGTLVGVRSHSRAAHLASPSASGAEPAMWMPFCGDLRDNALS
jgi:hypothetical protein